ncbi:MAG: hypothetical protein ACLQU3_22550 [Limisphaerales bacterium]
MNRRELEQAAITAADRCLKAKGYISMVDVLMECGKLSREDYEKWRFRQVPFLERVVQGNLAQINAMLRAVQTNSARGKMKASWTAYMSWGKGKRQPLRFSKSGNANLERAYATHYLSPREAQRSASHLNRSGAEKPEESKLDKLD